MLQSAVGTQNYSLYKKYSQMIDDNAAINIRDLLGYKTDLKKLILTEVQSAQDIRKRLVAPEYLLVHLVLKHMKLYQ